MHFIGHTRFSIYAPESRAWRASDRSRFKTEGDYRRYLFSDARLSIRADILLKFSLPQLEIAARGHNVTHLLSYSEHLPKKYEDMLLRAETQYPFLILERQQRGVPHATIEMISRGSLFDTADPYQPFGIYRLDDDDVLPVDYFAQNAPYVKQEHVGMQVSLGTGVSAIYKDGRFFNARKCYHPMLSIGYMSIHKFNEDASMTKLPPVSHSVADRHYPVIMDSRKLGYLWTRHTEQDTVLGLVETDQGSRIESLKKHMDVHPAIHDLEELNAAFPILADDITSASNPSSTRQELVTVPQIIPGTGLHLKSRRVSGELKVTTRLSCDMSSLPRNALLSFIFVDAEGLRVPPESLDDRLQGQGVSRSDNQRIGWFRYLGTRPGKNRTQTQFHLPEGVFVGAVRVIKWGRMSTTITIQSLSVESQA